MSTSTLEKAPEKTGGGVTGLFRGEWTKAASLRSTWYIIGGSAVVMALLSVLLTSTADTGGAAPGPPGAGQGPASPLALSLGGYTFAQLALGVLGVLLVTGEYTSGTIRSTFAAVPKRWPVVLGKAGVLGSVVLAGGLVVSFAAYGIGAAVLGDDGLGLGEDGVLRVVVGTALYLTCIALLGMGLGWLLRSTAGAVASLFGLVFLLPVLGNLLPSDWGPDVVRWLPGQAGGSLLQLTTGADSFAPWTGFAVLVGYVVVGLGAAIWRLRAQDV